MTINLLGHGSTQQDLLCPAAAVYQKQLCVQHAAHRNQHIAEMLLAEQSDSCRSWCIARCTGVPSNAPHHVPILRILLTAACDQEVVFDRRSSQNLIGLLCV